MLRQDADADAMALAVYRRSRAKSAPHELAFNIACSIWYARSLGPNGIEVRNHVWQLLTRAKADS